MIEGILPMDKHSLAKTQELEQLLQRYYAGDTTPEEELLLHLALLDEPEGSPWAKHLRVIESTMAAASHIKSFQTNPRIIRFRRISVGVASVAATIVALTLAVPRIQHEPSLRNGEPIAQEEVNKHAQQAFDMLASSLEQGAEQCDFLEAKLDETNTIMEATWDKLDEIQSNNNFILTGY